MRSTASSSTTFFAEGRNVLRYLMVGGAAAAVDCVSKLGGLLPSKLAATGTVFFWNYIARRRFVFAGTRD